MGYHSRYLKITVGCSLNNFLDHEFPLYLFISSGERFQGHDPKFQELLGANELFFRTGKVFQSIFPIPVFLLKRFRFMREFIGMKGELMEPIQKFIKVTYLK